MAVDREFVHIVWRADAGGPCSSQDQAHKTLKSDRGLNVGPRMTFTINKTIKILMFLKVQLSKVIKNIVFLKVRTRNFDRGLPFEIAKRSSPIGVSKTCQNEHIPGSCSKQLPQIVNGPSRNHLDSIVRWRAAPYIQRCSASPLLNTFQNSSETEHIVLHSRSGLQNTQLVRRPPPCTMQVAF